MQLKYSYFPQQSAGSSLSLCVNFMEGHFLKSNDEFGAGVGRGVGRGEGDVEKLFTVKSPEIHIYVARNFIMLNNILASLLPFAALVSPD